LDIIEKNMDKETESGKSRRHKYHDERRKTRSVDRHHHHSPRNLAGRERCSSISSPVRKHKRRYGLDELQGEMNKLKPPTFHGDHNKDGDEET
jgi:hypothetical protein